MKLITVQKLLITTMALVRNDYKTENQTQFELFHSYLFLHNFSNKNFLIGKILLLMPSYVLFEYIFCMRKDLIRLNLTIALSAL